MTLERMAIEQVALDPGATCARLCKVLNVKSASLSSTLKKLVDRGAMTRRPMGPRGGYGYFIRNDAADETISKSVILLESCETKPATC